MSYESVLDRHTRYSNDNGIEHGSCILCKSNLVCVPAVCAIVQQMVENLLACSGSKI